MANLPDPEVNDTTLKSLAASEQLPPIQDAHPGEDPDDPSFSDPAFELNPDELNPDAPASAASSANLSDPESQAGQYRSETEALNPAPALPVSLPRKVVRGLRRRANRLTQARVEVNLHTWDSITVSWKLPPRHNSYRLGVAEKSCRLSARSVHIIVPDLAGLTRLATSGVLTGSTFGLRITIKDLPRWLRGGNRSGRTLWSTTSQSWRVRPTASGTSLSATLTWSNKRPLDRALSDLLGWLSREQAWPLTGSTVYAEDRHAFARGANTWPRAYLVERSPYVSEEPLGPYTTPPPNCPVTQSSWPLITSVANPYQRELVGVPTSYQARLSTSNYSGGKQADTGIELVAPSGEVVLRLDPHRSPEAQINPQTAADKWVKFATLDLPSDWPMELESHRFSHLAIRGLAACGMILRCANPQVRQALQNQGLLVEDTQPPTPSLEVATPEEILLGYARSVSSSRTAMISSDALLRVSALAGAYGTPAALNPLVQLPTISITASSKRSHDIDSCLTYLAAQTYPNYEIVLGTHGYKLEPDFIASWQEKLASRNVALRVFDLPNELSFGQVLARLASRADGELITKVDDDDHYGPHHLTDLLLAHRFSGADMVAKSSRFTYFSDHDFTIDRTWGAKEAFDGTPAGGTMMITRATLAQIGGWSPSVRHVDTDLIDRAKAFAVPRYRTHSLGYVYVRRSSGHTWAANHEDLLQQSQHRYEGLPGQLLA